jgi:hypothetical protein
VVAWILGKLGDAWSFAAIAGREADDGSKLNGAPVAWENAGQGSCLHKRSRTVTDCKCDLESAMQGLWSRDMDELGPQETAQLDSD